MFDSVMKINNLSISFNRYQSLFGKGYLTAVECVNLEIKKNSIVAIVGASGSGKSLVAHYLMGILPINAKTTGTVSFLDEKLDKKRIEKCRGKEICFIPQSISYLDPILKIKKQLTTENKTNEELKALLNMLDLSPDVLNLYPYQLSGGMARRVLFATALINDAKLIIADEPTPGMDLRGANQALSILKNKVKEQNASMLFITHDIDLALSFADELVFFNEGRTVDSITPKEFNEGPNKNWNTFTQKMWHALPQNGFCS